MKKDPSDFSSHDAPMLNTLWAKPDYRADGPLSVMMDRLLPEGSAVARVDVMLPLGCNMSAFFVTGRNDEGMPFLSITMHRAIAETLANQANGGMVTELPIYLHDWQVKATPEGVSIPATLTRFTDEKPEEG